MELAEAIRTLREKRGLSQKQLAEAVSLTQVTVSRLECGHIKELKSGALGRLADVLSVSTDRLLGREDNGSVGKAGMDTRTFRLSEVYAKLPPAKKKLIDSILELIDMKSLSVTTEVPASAEGTDTGAREEHSAVLPERAPVAPVFRRTLYIAAPCERVWEALVTPKVVSQYFLCPLQHIDLRVGGEMVFGFPKKRLIDATISEVEPGRKLTHSFAFSADAGNRTSTFTRVTYQLTTANGLTQLDFTHDGFVADDEEYARASQGWDLILSGLKTLLETGKNLSDLN